MPNSLLYTDLPIKYMSPDPCPHHQDDEEERYFMDAAGNIGLREAPGTAPHRAPQPDTVPDDWAEGTNDQAYVEALEDFEKSIEFSEAASETDQVLLEFMTDFESG